MSGDAPARGDVLVRAEGVSKKFCRRLRRSLFYGVQDIAAELVARDISSQGLRPAEFWAIDNVSFEVRRGECLGLIGHNGAGKSTLLKMLNGLIKPDRGRIEMVGRVSSLIELGAGFNPVLTGRENIYVNGAVLGMTRKEIDDRFDAIVDFAEIGDFIDAPVQSYSTGMKVRLGFAAAAQVEPDVLLIDEVLAVGDLGFVIKCLNRMSQLLRRCAAVFVSQDMALVSRTCSSLLFLHHGVCKYFGSDVPRGLELAAQSYGAPPRQEQGSGEVIVETVGARATADDPYCFDGSHVHDNGSPFQVVLTLRRASPRALQALRVGLKILDGQQRDVVDCFSDYDGPPVALGEDMLTLEISIPALFLNQGAHTITTIVADVETKEIFARTTNAFSFLVRSPIRGWAGSLVPATWRVV